MYVVTNEFLIQEVLPKKDVGGSSSYYHYSYTSNVALKNQSGIPRNLFVKQLTC